MRLNHVTILVSDFEKSVNFYKTIGLQMIVYEAPRYARFQCPGSEETLSIEFTGEIAVSSAVQIYFECVDLDKTVADLKSKGISFEQDPTDMDYLWREARLLDPSGHQIRLYFAKDNRLNPPWKIKDVK